MATSANTIYNTLANTSQSTLSQSDTSMITSTLENIGKNNSTFASSFSNNTTAQQNTILTTLINNISSFTPEQISIFLANTTKNLNTTQSNLLTSTITSFTNGEMSSSTAANKLNGGQIGGIVAGVLTATCLLGCLSIKLKAIIGNRKTRNSDNRHIEYIARNPNPNEINISRIVRHPDVRIEMQENPITYPNRSRGGSFNRL